MEKILKQITFYSNSVVVDANDDHNFIIKHVLEHLDSNTNYLFFAHQVREQRLYIVQSSEKCLMKQKKTQDFEDLLDLSPYNDEENQFNFYIRVNPAIKKRIPDNLGSKDKMISITGEPEIIMWSKAKFVDHGIAVTGIDILYKNKIFCSRGKTWINEALLKVNGYCFNQKKVKNLQVNGFGKRKGYGFGMMIPEGSFGYNELNKIYT